MKTTILSVAAVLGMTFLTACNDFLDEQKPQGTVDNELLKDPQYVDNLIIPAYAIWISAEDINSSFSMWNYDVRSDDAYKGATVRRTVTCSMPLRSRKES